MLYCSRNKEPQSRVEYLGGMQTKCYLVIARLFENSSNFRWNSAKWGMWVSAASLFQGSGSVFLRSKWYFSGPSLAASRLAEPLSNSRSRSNFCRPAVVKIAGPSRFQQNEVTLTRSIATYWIDGPTLALATVDIGIGYMGFILGFTILRYR